MPQEFNNLKMAAALQVTRSMPIAMQGLQQQLQLKCIPPYS
jgi:hypothetical protein